MSRYLDNSITRIENERQSALEAAQAQKGRLIITAHKTENTIMTASVWGGIVIGILMWILATFLTGLIIGGCVYGGGFLYAANKFKNEQEKAEQSYNTDISAINRDYDKRIETFKKQYRNEVMRFQAKHSRRLESLYSNGQGELYWLVYHSIIRNAIENAPRGIAHVRTDIRIICNVTLTELSVQCNNQDDRFVFYSADQSGLNSDVEIIGYVNAILPLLKDRLSTVCRQNHWDQTFTIETLYPCSTYNDGNFELTYRGRTQQVPPTRSLTNASGNNTSDNKDSNPKIIIHSANSSTESPNKKKKIKITIG